MQRIHFTGESDGKAFWLLAEAMIARQSLYKWNLCWQVEQLRPSYVTGSLAKSGI